MAARKPVRTEAPFPLQIEVEFLDRLSEPVRDGKVKSVSALIRAALERFAIANLVVVRPAQLTISVRLPVELRRELRKVARTKHTSVGQIVRAAVEAYLPEVEAQAPVAPAAAPARGRRARKRGKAPRAMTRKPRKG